ncbi:hypothetical protein D915_000112 [Fasciola hepatica]|uniref:Uncharacterized protein n=1 Tax=Fasciola hepatica TaxID=6192 RepID=A0A4E0RN18_FASHE|nr:hypothetical protein D915_000112 [Fasciola hepatica]
MEKSVFSSPIKLFKTRPFQKAQTEGVSPLDEASVHKRIDVYKQALVSFYPNRIWLHMILHEDPSIHSPRQACMHPPTYPSI